MKPLGIYIHWPFCLSKCPYCDFNSHVRTSIDQGRWKKALLKELESAANGFQQRVVTSVFFGGGTPSLMDPEIVEALLDRIHSLFHINNKLEVTLEANPSTVEAGRFKAFSKASVNRLSIGVQSFNDKSLSFLGRRHSSQEALKALDIAQKYFPRYSFDLIYALPGQTREAWEQELQQAFQHANGHLSLYQLTIEPNTQFATRFARGERMTLPEDPAAELYEMTEKLMVEAGMPPYEVSNYAAKGHECQHNLLYWRFEDYIGIGPGAHGRITQDKMKYATFRFRAPETWLTKVEEKADGLELSQPLSSQQRFQECVLMGFRMTEGLSWKRLFEETGCERNTAFKESKLKVLEENKLLKVTESHVTPTFQGRMKLNFVLGFLLDE